MSSTTSKNETLTEIRLSTSTNETSITIPSSTSKNEPSIASTTTAPNNKPPATISAVASVSKSSIQSTIDTMRQNLDEIVQLSNQRFQLASEKARYEYTERHQHARQEIHNLGKRFKQLCQNIEDGNELLKCLQEEFDQFIEETSFRTKHFGMDGISRKTSITSIKNEIRKIPGVKVVKVLPVEKEIQVKFDIDQTSEQTILNVITNLGLQSGAK